MYKLLPAVLLVGGLLGLFGGTTTHAQSHSDSDIIRQRLGGIDQEKGVVDKTGWAPLFGEPNVPNLVGDPTRTGDKITLKWLPDVVRHPPVTYEVFCAIGGQSSCTSVDTADITGTGQRDIAQSPIYISGTVRGVAPDTALTCFIVATNESGKTCSDPIPVNA